MSFWRTWTVASFCPGCILSQSAPTLKSNQFYSYSRKNPNHITSVGPNPRFEWGKTSHVQNRTSKSQFTNCIERICDTNYTIWIWRLNLVKIVCNSFSWGHLKAHLAFIIKGKAGCEIPFTLPAFCPVILFFEWRKGEWKKKKRKRKMATIKCPVWGFRVLCV